MNKSDQTIDQTALSIGSIVLGVLLNFLIFVAIIIVLQYSVGTSFPGFDAAALIIGFLCALIGAYFAARRALARPIAHGLWVGATILAISLTRLVVFSLWPPRDPAAIHPLWFEFIGWALVLGAGYLGGLIVERSSDRQLITSRSHPSR